MKTNQLNYSPLSDTIYWVDAKGKKKDVTQNFIQMMLLYINESETPEVGKGNVRSLRVNGEVHWEIQCKHIAE